MSEVPVAVEQPKPVEVTDTPAVVEPVKTEETPAVVSLIFQIHFLSLPYLCPLQTETPAPVVEETSKETPATGTEDQKEVAKPVRENFPS